MLVTIRAWTGHRCTLIPWYVADPGRGSLHRVVETAGSHGLVDLARHFLYDIPWLRSAMPCESECTQQYLSRLSTCAHILLCNHFESLSLSSLAFHGNRACFDQEFLPKDMFTMLFIRPACRESVAQVDPKFRPLRHVHLDPLDLSHVSRGSRGRIIG